MSTPTILTVARCTHCGPTAATGTGRCAHCGATDLALVTYQATEIARRDATDDPRAPLRFPGVPNLDPAALVREDQAVQAMLDLGVTLGTATTLGAGQRRLGHVACAYHLVVTETGEDYDGGSASMLLDYLTDGTYPGQPGDYTLSPCR